MTRINAESTRPAVVRHDSVSRNYATRSDMSDCMSLFLLKFVAPSVGMTTRPRTHVYVHAAPEIFTGTNFHFDETHCRRQHERENK